MKDGVPDRYDEEAGEALLNAGWRQGSAFRMPTTEGVSVPYDPASEWLVVCTQSCSVVSYRFDADPHVEVAVAKQVKKFKSTAAEAMGKNFRRFHMPVVDGVGFGALDCDINRRFFIPRDRFLAMAPETQATPEGAKALGGWLARYFSRVALPNELVKRARREGGLFEVVKTALDAPYGGEPMSERVDAIYVKWVPDTEIGDGQAYKLDLLFLCDRTTSMADFEQSVADGLEPFSQPGGRDGIELTWSVAERNSTVVGLIAPYSRLSEWDHLSDLAEVAGDYEKLSPFGN